jgi:tRNA dimethylallyltransferase
MVGVARSRATLPDRVVARFRQQLADGFLDEARALLERHGERLSRTAAQALGYRELWAHLRDPTGTLHEAVAEAVLRTRQYAVRQERWFRRDVRIGWLDADAHGVDALARIVVTDFLTKR